MFTALLHRLISGKPSGRAANAPLRLHIGGEIAHPDWKIFNIEAGPQVDYVGHCADLSRFGDAGVGEIYASHVLEHLHFKTELPAALREFHRVLQPGGSLRISVPDLKTLCTLFLDPAMTTLQRFQIMQMMYGGQTTPADAHHVGLDEEFLTQYLQDAGFVDIARVERFGIFDDASNMQYKLPVSLNMQARKPG